MKIFFSLMTGGSYNTEWHGTRELTINDPKWVRPTIQVPQDDGNGGTVMVDVPDESAVHPVITVPNPDCKIPADAVEITAAEHAALLDARSQGKHIQADATGRPVAVDPPPPSDAELAAVARAKRDRMIADCDWTVLPDAPLTSAQLTAWKAYRQALRDVTQQAGFPQQIDWPVAP